MQLSQEEYFTKFIEIGGLPAVKHFQLNPNPSYKYLSDIYNTVLVKDVLEYNQIRDIDIFNRILLYTAEILVILSQH